jgi:hypothetical protein
VRKNHSKTNRKGSIVIDPDKGLAFDSEEDLFEYFVFEINKFEKEFFKLRNPKVDIAEEDFIKYESQLSPCLESPDEIWEDKNSLPEQAVRIYLKYFELKKGSEDFCCHVAICYLAAAVPTFVYLHFPTIDGDLIEKYRRGELIYDRSLLNIPVGAVEGDAMAEGDELALGLYKAMLLVRGEKDIPETEFQAYSQLREATLEEADEIWRNTDSSGTILVTFIKEFPEEGPEETFYLVVTLEDVPSNSHALLFSFPTQDRSLVERYRHGENLQAEEVVQEASH